MILIIGGACQGKWTYAKEYTKVTQWCDGAVCTREELFHAQGVFHFELFLRRELEAENNVETLADELMEKNRELVIVSQEVGYGLVPMDAFDRVYREAVGRICTKLAAEAIEVHRVICGIGRVIKHD